MARARVKTGGFIVALAAAALVAGAIAGHHDRKPARRAVVACCTAKAPPDAQRAPCFYTAAGALPDPLCTPGAINHAVTQRTIKATICKPGWAGSVRPPSTATEPWKFRAMRAYGIDTGVGQAQLYEYDHLIPIELGGALLDTRNLFPEPRTLTVGGQDEGSRAKDKTENRLRALVCAGKATLARARAIERTDWRTAP